ncbi:hypothetical protein CBI31_04330 [Polynucleobacter campilacus]|uniref:Uncharacterized protein n=1 Tax=Polynucleobacter campilacus TaxID=1743163 RepID=A0A254PSU0_9BURK|nr:hypothetical protein CBI31_04330 [Polynucleobacter campilacus]
MEAASLKLRGYSGLMPALLIILPQRADSFFRKTPKVSGLMGGNFEFHSLSSANYKKAPQKRGLGC